MLHYGLRHALENSSSLAGTRGFKFVTLAKHVTTSTVRGGEARGSHEVLGRIRMVMCGGLESLFVKMCEEADQAAEDAQAELEAQQVALDEKCARAAAAAGGGALGETAADSVRARHARDKEALSLGERDKCLLSTVLRLVNAGYLSKGYAAFGR